jgi:hypothetical protein
MQNTVKLYWHFPFCSYLCSAVRSFFVELSSGLRTELLFFLDGVEDSFSLPSNLLLLAPLLFPDEGGVAMFILRRPFPPASELFRFETSFWVTGLMPSSDLGRPLRSLWRTVRAVRLPASFAAKTFKYKVKIGVINLMQPQFIDNAILLPLGTGQVGAAVRLTQA